MQHPWSGLKQRVYDTLEECVLDIEELKDELSMIQMTQTPSGRDKWDTPEFQYRKYGWWSDNNFMPGMYVKELYLDKVEFAGMIANGRVFRGDKGRYVTFLTLGIGNGQYIDVTIKKAFAYSDYDVVWGQGTIRHSNNSDYVESFEGT